MELVQWSFQGQGDRHDQSKIKQDDVKEFELNQLYRVVSVTTDTHAIQANRSKRAMETLPNLTEREGRPAIPLVVPFPRCTESHRRTQTN